MFACVCAQKSVELGADKKLHRALKDQQIQSEVEQLRPRFASDDAAMSCAFQTGGGVRMDGQAADLSLASVDTCVAVFQGQLQNAGELARRCPAVAGCAATTVGAGTLAELLCRLYVAYGVELLSILKGTYSVCLYESKTARVLAMSDATGAVQLFEGRTASGDLIVASSQEYLTNCTDVVQFQPGDYKYGWHAIHRQYDASDFASDQRGRKSSLDGHQAHPHHGLGNGSTARRRSLDHAQGTRSPSSHSNQRVSGSSSPTGAMTPPRSQQTSDHHAPPLHPRHPCTSSAALASRLARCSLDTPSRSRRTPATHSSSGSRSGSSTPPKSPPVIGGAHALDPAARVYTPIATPPPASGGVWQPTSSGSQAGVTHTNAATQGTWVHQNAEFAKHSIQV